MDKRTFLKTSAVIGTGILLSPYYACTPNEKETPENQERNEAFALPALAFATDALAPSIDQRTMEIHHGKHHAGYVKKLNDAVAGTKFEKMPLLDILQNIGAEDTAVRNNGGGHYNHSLFWEILSPNASTPSGDLAKAIEELGGYDKFKNDFSAAAKGVFGSGWAWLCLNNDKKLFITTTPNQDNPLMTNIAEEKGTPILGIDVWEHAYYLNYQNLRGDYISNFFNVINWAKVAEKYAEAVK